MPNNASQWDDPQRAQHYAHALEQLSDAVIECSEDLVVVAWNQGAERVFGYTAQQAVGRNLVGLILNERDAATWNKQRKQEGTGVLQCVRQDGSTLWCEWRSAELPDGATLCFGQDVTTRIQATRQLEHHDLLLRAVLNSLKVAICSFDKQGNFTFHDGKAVLDSGLQPGQFVGQNALTLFGYDPDLRDALERALRGEVLHAMSELYDLSWESWYEPIHDPATGELIGAISVTLNISESKRHAKELQAKLDLIELQQKTIRELQTPIIEVWDGVLTLPMVGVVDSRRAAEVMQNLLSSVVTKKTRFAILDLTGVETIDTATANHLVNMIRAIRLLGAEGILTGIRPSVAQIVVSLGLDLGGIATYATLRAALMHCIQQMNASASGEAERARSR